MHDGKNDAVDLAVKDRFHCASLASWTIPGLNDEQDVACVLGGAKGTPDQSTRES